MNNWELAYLALMVLSVGANIAKDGEPVEGHHSMIRSVVHFLIDVWILYNAGLFH